MSTNYYICQKVITSRWGSAMEFIDFRGDENDPYFQLHLCHVASGWKTLFQATPLYKSFESLIAECEYSIANNGGIIRNEYGDVLTLDEFKEKVLWYKDMEPRMTEQMGVKIMVPIDHEEYIQRVHHSPDVSKCYFKDHDGYDFCMSVFS